MCILTCQKISTPILTLLEFNHNSLCYKAQTKNNMSTFTNFVFPLSQLQHVLKSAECFRQRQRSSFSKEDYIHLINDICKSQLNAVLIEQCNMDPASTFNCMWIIVSLHTKIKICVNLILNIHTHTHHFLSEDIKHSQKKKNKDTNKQTKPKKHMPVSSCPQMLCKFNSSNHKTIHLHPYQVYQDILLAKILDLINNIKNMVPVLLPASIVNGSAVKL